MGAIERNGFRFEPEFSVISQNGAIHVFHNGKFLEELKFEFSGKFPENDQIEEMVAQYCNRHGL
ncbi:YbxH family protein [Cytobacillus firmus]|uniref:YbxH family protein n=1 Tax=Cytobacillus firmus TaxID=1399 RepID=UPI002161ED92|nr:YbxH family protein [Cytobacillus firmus]MCS0674083.1 YbxH family protein [Cytobacillus firmus]